MHSSIRAMIAHTNDNAESRQLFTQSVDGVLLSDEDEDHRYHDPEQGRDDDSLESDLSNQLDC